MKLSTAFELFDRARTGEVAKSTRRWFYWHNQKTGKRGGKLWSLVDVLGDKEIQDITIHDLRQWRVALLERQTRWKSSSVRRTKAGGLSQDGFRNYIRAAKQFFKWLHDEGELPENPAARLPIPPPSTDEPKAICVDDAQRVLELTYWLALRDRAYYCLHCETGAKVGELDRLRLDDIDPYAETITITRYIRKRYKPRTLPISNQTAVLLARWLHFRPNLIATPEEKELAFTGRQGHFGTCLRGGIAFGVRNYAILQALASSATRAGGIAGLRIGDLRLDDGLATVYEKGKGGYLKPRFIFLDDDACDAITDWLAVHPGDVTNPETAVFVGLYGKTTRNGVYQVVINLADEAGVTDNINPHAWRHAWSIEALRNGADVPTVAKVLGNKPETVMQSYARWAPTEIQQRHRQFSWKANGNGYQKPENKNGSLD